MRVVFPVGYGAFYVDAFFLCSQLSLGCLCGGKEGHECVSEAGLTVVCVSGETVYSTRTLCSLMSCTVHFLLRRKCPYCYLTLKSKSTAPEKPTVTALCGCKSVAPLTKACISDS